MEVNRKKRRNKLLSLLLSVSLVMATFVFPKGNLSLFEEKASAASVDDLTFEVVDGEAVVTDCNSDAAGEIIIPTDTEIDGAVYKVVSIGNYAFSYCDRLKNITIPDSVKSIGSYTFKDCTGLESIVIPDSVISIGDSAFNSCDSLSEIRIGKNVESIGNGAFYDCPNLSDITVDEDNRYYSADSGVLFNKEKTLLIYYPAGNGKTSYTIPSTVTKISDDAFILCTSLLEVNIPDSVTEIGYSSFYEVRNVSYSNDMIASGSPWGAKCVNGYVEEQLVYTDSSKKELVTCGASATGNVIIPDSVIDIKSRAFEGCSGVSSITIGSGAADVEKDAFYGCENLSEILVSSDNNSFASDNGVLFNKDKSILIRCPEGKIDSYVLPESTRIISEEAFFYCGKIKRVSLNDGLEAIEQYAFRYCVLLEKIETPDNVTLGGGVFANCYSLKEAVIGKTESIPSGAFLECFILRDVYLPDNLKEICVSAFRECRSIHSLTVPKSVTHVELSPFNGDWYALSKLIILNRDLDITNFGIYVDTTLSDEDYEEYYSLALKIYPLLCGLPGTVTEEELERFDEIVSNHKKTNFKIYAYEGSLAQAQAEEYGLDFIPIYDSTSDSSGVSVSFDIPQPESGELTVIPYTARAPKACTYTVAGMNQKGLYEICVKDINGNIIQPEGGKSFTVSIPVNYSDGTKLDILHIESDGKTSSIINTTVTDGKIVFNIDRQ